MTSKVHARRRDVPRTNRRNAHSPHLNAVSRAIARTLVYVGLIAASILIWWAIGKLALG